MEMDFRKFFRYVLPTTKDEHGALGIMLNAVSPHAEVSVNVAGASLKLYRDNKRCFVQLIDENKNLIRIVGHMTREATLEDNKPPIRLAGIEIGEEFDGMERIDYVFTVPELKGEDSLVGNYGMTEVMDGGAEKLDLTEMRQEATAAALDYAGTTILGEETPDFAPIRYLFKTGEIRHLPNIGASGTRSARLVSVMRKKGGPRPGPGG